MFRIGRLPFRGDTALSPLSAALASSSKRPHGQGTGLPHSGRLPFRLCLRRLQARSAGAASPRKQANSKATSSRLRSKFMSGASWQKLVDCEVQGGRAPSHTRPNVFQSLISKA